MGVWGVVCGRWVQPAGGEGDGYRENEEAGAGGCRGTALAVMTLPVYSYCVQGIINHCASEIQLEI